MVQKESIERCEKALEEYLSTNQTIREICSKYGICRSFMAGFCTGRGIDIYSRKSHSNSTIFDSIDTEEKAYWLGFLYADGSVHKYKSSYSVELGLAAVDLHHIEKFKKFIGTDNKICFREPTNSYRLAIGSRLIVEDLISKGCTINKSLTLTFPDYSIVPKELMRHFIRGYFDGDGCISIETQKHGLRKWVSVIGTFEFLSGMLNEAEITRPVIKDKRHTKVYYVQFRKDEGLKFLDYMYKDATIYLDRKYEKYNLPSTGVIQ